MELTQEELIENWYDIQDLIQETKIYNNEEPPEECQTEN